MDRVDPRNPFAELHAFPDFSGLPSWLTISKQRWGCWPQWVRAALLERLRYSVEWNKPDEIEKVLYPALYYEALPLAIGHVNALLVHRFPLPSHNDSFFAPGKVSRGLRYPLFPLPAERGYTDDDFETALTVLESETILRSGQRLQVAWDIRKYLKGGRRSQSWSEQRPEDRVHVTQNLFRVHLCALVGLSMWGLAQITRLDQALPQVDAFDFFPHFWPEERHRRIAAAQQGWHDGSQQMGSLGALDRRIGYRAAQIYGTTPEAFAAGRAFQ